MGGAYYVGVAGASHDIAKAKPLFQKGCLLKDGGSCTWLGEMHEVGNGFERDFAKAKTLYQKGCEFNFSDSCIRFQNLNEQFKDLVPANDQAVLKELEQDLAYYQQYNNKLSNKIEQSRNFVIESHGMFNILNL